MLLLLMIAMTPVCLQHDDAGERGENRPLLGNYSSGGGRLYTEVGLFSVVVILLSLFRL